MPSTQFVDGVEHADEELAHKASYDFDAFTELYRRYSCSIYRFMRARTPNDDVAEDLTAQVFFKALNCASGYRGEGSYSSWLFQIGRNVLSTWNSTRGRAAVSVDKVPETQDPQPGPAAQLLVDEARREIWALIAGLPRAQAEVVSLRYLKDLSIEEIAEHTRRSRGAVRILLHKARNRLRADLETEEVG